MKKIFVFICLVFAFNSINAQDILASTLKIGPFALDMKLKDIEAIALKKIDVAAIEKSIKDYKPIEVQLNGVKFKLTFFETYSDKGERTGEYKLYRIECNDSRVKTKSGIAYGMDRNALLQLVNKMDVGYTFSKYNEYDDNGKPTKKFIENLSIFDSQAGKTLFIRLKDGKVSGFEIAYEEGC
jgi:hypothetical protein